MSTESGHALFHVVARARAENCVRLLRFDDKILEELHDLEAYAKRRAAELEAAGY